MLSNQLTSFELEGGKNFILNRVRPMSKRKRIKDKQESKKKSAQIRKVQETADDEKTDTMDFGGLPNRNLKKNLGCG